MSAIKLNSVTKRYGSVCAVRDASFTVDEGEFISILGPSGCGKTTLLRLIAGFETPNEGEILIGGNVVSHLPPWKRNIGVVFQSYALFPYLTVEANIAFGLERRNVDKAEILEKTNDVLKIVGLEGFQKRYPRQLSGGQAQRVALARAIVYEPEILLLDEPLSALDARLRDEMRFELQRIQNETGVTTLFVTHDQSEALAISDSIIVMNNSVICQVGSPENVWRTPETKFVADFVGVENIFEIASISSYCTSANKDSNSDKFSRLFQKDDGFTSETVGIRGRDIKVATKPLKDHLMVSGKVRGMNYLGHERVYEIDTPLSSKPVTLIVEAGQKLGNEVTLALAHDKFLGLKEG